MRFYKWDYLLDRLIRRLGEPEGKRWFFERWQQAGEKFIESYEAEERLR